MAGPLFHHVYDSDGIVVPAVNSNVIIIPEVLPNAIRPIIPRCTITPSLEVTFQEAIGTHNLRMLQTSPQVSGQSKTVTNTY